MKIAELLQSLSDHQVQYVLVGGLAVQLHGFLRATFDIDLVLALNLGTVFKPALRGTPCRTFIADAPTLYENVETEATGPGNA